MQYTIEKDVPVPEPHRGNVTPRRVLYPFAQMEPGDSFVETRRKGETLPKCAVRMRSASASAAARNGHRYAVRQVFENGVRAVRVWRVN